MWLSTLRHRTSLRGILKSASTTAPQLHRTTRLIVPNARISTTPRANMSSSDDAYAAFLKKSQKDYSGGTTGIDDASPAHVTNTPQIERNPHPAINALGSERFYTSDVDEAFEPVSLSWTKESLPTGDEFAELVGGGSDVEVLEPSEWDRRGQYKDVVDAVSAASEAAVKVYRAERGTRVVYYVVGLDTKAGKVVGMRVKAVES